MGRADSRAIFSERGFHRWLRRTYRGVPTGLLPIGDDAAAIPIGGRTVAVLTTDALVEGTHFLRGSPPEAIGHAAAAVSLSDVAAKGATPVALLLDLLLPPRTPPRWARAVVRGAEREMSRFGGHVVGGDTKPSATRTVVGSLLAIGRSDRLAPRSGGRPGDLLVVTGTVGRGGADWRDLRSGRASRRALAHVLQIRPRVREGAALARYATAMLDTSDGVADSAWILAEASGVRVLVDDGSLPVDPRLARRAHGSSPSDRLAFFGGDFELMAAVPPGRWRSARRSLSRLGCPLTTVGTLEAGAGAWLVTGPRRVRMPRAGWQPFDRAVDVP